MMNQGYHRRRGSVFLPGRSDIYTLLMLIACLALLVGIGFIWYRGAELFGTSNPFEVVSQRDRPAPVGRAVLAGCVTGSGLKHAG